MRASAGGEKADMPPTASGGLPEGVRQALWFQICNSASFCLVIGTPMVLFFKSLGASAVVLGIVQGLPALLTVLQIPAARFVEQVGYRAFVLRGWGVRSLFILFLALLAVWPVGMEAMTRMALALFFLFGYNFARGISSCGWLPWITQLVPEGVRGRYISLDQMCGFSAIVVTSLISGWIMEQWKGLMGFAVVFFISFVGAVASLYFLRRIPDVPVSEAAGRGSAAPVPWAALWGHGPFRRIVLYNMAVLFSWAGGGLVVVPFLRDVQGISDGAFMHLNALWGIIFIGVIYGLGRWVDRTGSRPMLVHSAGWQVIHYGGWGAIAAGWLPFTWWTVIFQQLSWAVCFALFSLANVRLLMATVPAMGRSHFFAIHSVLTSLVAGCAPLVWGGVIDGLLRWGLPGEGGSWTAYSVVYGLVLLCVAWSSWLLRGIEEPAAISAEELFRKFFIETPVHGLGRLFQRKGWPQ